MLKPTKKADYGLIAVKHLAELGPRGSCSAKDIAEAYRIPAEALAKILQKLAKSKLLVSHHGTNGGYALARERRMETPTLQGSYPSTWITSPPRRCIRVCLRQCCPTTPNTSGMRPAAITNTAGKLSRQSRSRASRLRSWSGPRPKRSSSPPAP